MKMKGERLTNRLGNFVDGSFSQIILMHPSSLLIALRNCEKGCRVGNIKWKISPQKNF